MVASMEVELYLESANVAFSIVLLAWIFLDFFKRRRDNAGDVVAGYSGHRLTRKLRFFSIVTVVSNIIICILHLGFGFCVYWTHRTVSSKSVFSALTWAVASLVAIYSKIGTFGRFKWPLVLILWWVFSSIVGAFCVSVYLIKRFRLIEFRYPLPQANVADFSSFPLSILLCFNCLASGCFVEERENECEEPLLHKVDRKSSQVEAKNFSNAGVWSQLTFQWLNPLFELGRIQKLELHHIPPVLRSECAEDASSMLEESLHKQKQKQKQKQKMEACNSLPKAIGDAVWKPLAVNAVFAGINTIASYMGPLLITDFVDFLSNKTDNSSYQYGLILAFIFFFSKTVESLTQRQWYFGAQRIGIQVRAALTLLIYKKSLSAKFLGSSNGIIINLINVDIDRIGEFCWSIHGIWLLPVQVILALLILRQNLGAAPAFAALCATVFVMVSNTPLARKQERFHSKIMEAKDTRIKATSETLKSMRVLKLQSWEPTFLKKILKLRETESNWLKKYLYTCSAVAFLFWASPTLVSAVTFAVCILFRTPLTPGTVLSALATFKILQEPIYNLPELISMIAQTKVSIDRIQEFIKGEDLKRSAPHNNLSSSGVAVEINVAEYAWDASIQNLKEPTIKIKEKMRIMNGSKIAVCGSVGSGKSSLLCSILGEIPKISGAGIEVHGKKAYVPQSAWIQTGTIRDNILFGKVLDKAFYEDVIQACALTQDIEMFADGDCSVVGERGMNLSGGQKQRIQLARVVYSDSDVYILDDPFSAVDAHTGTHIFRKCLMELLSRKTVIYTTHQMEFLDAADLVMVIKDGTIVQSGKYEDLISDSGGELVRQMNAHRKTLNKVSPRQKDNFLSTATCQTSQIEISKEILPSMPHGKPIERSLGEEEITGRVGWHVYSTFVTMAFKGALVPVVLLCQVLFQGLQIASSYWIAWATEEKHKIHRSQLIGIFILLSGGGSFFILGRAVLLATIAIETAQRFFVRMITSVFRAPILFFDTTPSSRILHRSSSDQSTLDTDIPYRLAGLAFALIQLLSIITLMSWVAWPVFVLFLVIFGISIWYQAYYITTARELARMVGMRKAPILHHFSESIAGAATIRCFAQENRFLRRVICLIDDYSRTAFHNYGTMEWLSVRINFLFNLVFFMVLVILVSLPRSAIDPSLAGLVATYGLNLNVLQAWVIWNLCNVENKMISVERVLQFTDIPSEAPLVIEGCRSKLEWPTDGRIELENLKVQYSPSLPMVLKGITCTFPGQKKIGVVGRTGSGKSTLIQALFRVVEPSGGRILIDGLDISTIGLQDLRSKLGIIPQDPTLFRGTIRSNVDPLEQHTDQEIWEVLNKCHLADIVKQDQRLLDAPVAEDGENWSLGQRQLVCLARVLVKRRRILVLDEATASIDTATDNLIQETIREETKGRTVITVAHRIPTVVGNDLVLVLDEGQVLEYDSPKKLLDDSNSSFSKLVEEFLRRSSKSTKSSSVSCRSCEVSWDG